MSALDLCGTIPCGFTDLSPEQVLRLILRRDLDGCLAFAVKQVENSQDTCDLFLDCDNNEIAAQQLFYRLLYFDNQGCPAIRVVID